jgi:hypothetical protein
MDGFLYTLFMKKRAKNLYAFYEKACQKCHRIRVTRAIASNSNVQYHNNNQPTLFYGNLFIYSSILFKTGTFTFPYTTGVSHDYFWRLFYSYELISLFLLGIVLRRLFCVRTMVDQIIF